MEGLGHILVACFTDPTEDVLSNRLRLLVCTGDDTHFLATPNKGNVRWRNTNLLNFFPGKAPHSEQCGLRYALLRNLRAAVAVNGPTECKEHKSGERIRSQCVAPTPASALRKRCPRDQDDKGNSDTEEKDHGADVRSAEAQWHG